MRPFFLEQSSATITNCQLGIILRKSYENLVCLQMSSKVGDSTQGEGRLRKDAEEKFICTGRQQLGAPDARSPKKNHGYPSHASLTLFTSVPRLASTGLQML